MTSPEKSMNVMTMKIISVFFKVEKTRTKIHLEKSCLFLLTISVFQSVWIDLDTNGDTKPHNQLASQPINPTNKGYNMMAQTQAIGNFW